MRNISQCVCIFKKSKFVSSSEEWIILLIMYVYSDIKLLQEGNKFTPPTQPPFFFAFQKKQQYFFHTNEAF